jgi:hypothetical protein
VCHWVDLVRRHTRKLKHGKVCINVVDLAYVPIEWRMLQKRIKFAGKKGPMGGRSADVGSLISAMWGRW